MIIYLNKNVKGGFTIVRNELSDFQVIISRVEKVPEQINQFVDDQIVTIEPDSEQGKKILKFVENNIPNVKKGAFFLTDITKHRHEGAF